MPWSQRWDLGRSHWVLAAPPSPGLSTLLSSPWSESGSLSVLSSAGPLGCLPCRAPGLGFNGCILGVLFHVRASTSWRSDLGQLGFQVTVGSLAEGKAPPPAGARWKDMEWGGQLSRVRQRLQRGPVPTWEATCSQAEAAPRSRGQVPGAAPG